MDIKHKCDRHSPRIQVDATKSKIFTQPPSQEPRPIDHCPTQDPVSTPPPTLDKQSATSVRDAYITHIPANFAKNRSLDALSMYFVIQMSRAVRVSTTFARRARFGWSAASARSCCVNTGRECATCARNVCIRRMRSARSASAAASASIRAISAPEGRRGSRSIACELEGVIGECGKMDIRHVPPRRVHSADVEDTVGVKLNRDF